MMKKEKLKFEEAYSYVKERRSIIRPHPSFVEKLMQLEGEK
jgi:hypothetical protein